MRAFGCSESCYGLDAETVRKAIICGLAPVNARSGKAAERSEAPGRHHVQPPTWLVWTRAYARKSGLKCGKRPGICSHGIVRVPQDGHEGEGVATALAQRPEPSRSWADILLAA